MRMAPSLRRRLHRLKDADVRFTAREQAEKLVGLLQGATFWTGKAGQTLKLRNPLPPFTTSSSATGRR
jgi:hypothetical protein